MPGLGTAIEPEANFKRSGPGLGKARAIEAS
jgi:hypothetical protein